MSKKKIAISQKKKRLLSRDYRRNVHFKDLIERYRKAESTEEKNELKLETAEKLGVGLDEFEILEALGEDFEIRLNEDGTEISQVQIDMCKIKDKVSENKLDVRFPTAIPVSRDLSKEMGVIAYPVSIDINKFATPKDIERFIASHRNEIEILLKKYRDKKKTIRSRPNEERDNFIYRYWDQEMKKGRKKRDIVKDLTGEDKKVYYPGKPASPNEILGIIRTEKKRRNKKIV